MALAMAWTAVSRQDRPVYPFSEDDLIIADFTIPEHWPRGYGLDSRWDSVGAIWGAYDRDNDRLYLYSEYLSGGDPAIHAAAIRNLGDWIPGFIDPRGNGREEADGRRLIQMYRRHGLLLRARDNPLESGVLDMLQRMRSGRLKVFASLARFQEELKSYQRDERGQIVKERDQLLDAARGLVMGIDYMCTKPVKRGFPPVPSIPSGERSWMGYGG
jgi:hypothetical protein